MAVTSQLESLRRAKATGCWHSREFCPQTTVNVSEKDVIAHAAKAREWYSTVRSHAAEHPRTPLLSLTTEGFLQIPQTRRSPYLPLTRHAEFERWIAGLQHWLDSALTVEPSITRL